MRTADTEAADADTTQEVPMPERAEPPAGGDADDALAWFTAVVREHSTALVRYFARRDPRQDAEDLAAEVFATAWRRRAHVPREAALPWLYRTAGFTLANHRRKLVDLPVEDVPESGERRSATSRTFARASPTTPTGSSPTPLGPPSPQPSPTPRPPATTPDVS
ncbi:sigma factor [Agromyces sp. NPDC049794]|uniref:RNA polymerase sigma factor n=1 Tax=unclassified Agromyces TaxID=2639701 RepID=UPI0033D65D32